MKNAISAIRELLHRFPAITTKQTSRIMHKNILPNMSQPKQNVSHEISFTEEEKVVLKSLLLDGQTKSSTSIEKTTTEETTTSTRSLTAEMLLSLPVVNGIEYNYSLESNHSMDFDKYYIPDSESKEELMIFQGPLAQEEEDNVIIERLGKEQRGSIHGPRSSKQIEFEPNEAMATKKKEVSTIETSYKSTISLPLPLGKVGQYNVERPNQIETERIVDKFLSSNNQRQIKTKQTNGSEITTKTLLPLPKIPQNVRPPKSPKLPSKNNESKISKLFIPRPNGLVYHSRNRTIGTDKMPLKDINIVPSQIPEIIELKKESDKSPIPRPSVLMNQSRSKSVTYTNTTTSNSLNYRNKPNSKNHAALWLAHDQSCKEKESKQANLNEPVIDMKELLSERVLADKSDEESSHESNGGKRCDLESMESKTSETLPESMRSPEFSLLSINEGDCNFEPFDCWQILKDEYTKDYGFAAKEAEQLPKVNKETSNCIREDRDPSEDCDIDIIDDIDLHRFKILGTGADDLSAQPHVLSPPLMDSLLNFVPNAQKYDNFWLKYSLVRDGSCIDTFQQYTKASSNTILAILTTKGEVFGSFTTSPWENHGLHCYGNGESFVWKMRFKRSTNCSSLYDQAHLESEIDVYPYSGFNSTVQVFTNTMIALGGTEIEKQSSLGFNYQDYQQKTNEELSYQSDKNTGFAIALHDEMSHGTTSQCPTFCSPSLLSDGGEFFDVQNVEVWTFTSMESVIEAQKLEMRKHFVSQHNIPTSTRTRLGSRGSSISSVPEFSSKDLFQGSFYRRLGE